MKGGSCILKTEVGKEEKVKSVGKMEASSPSESQIRTAWVYTKAKCFGENHNAQILSPGKLRSI